MPTSKVPILLDTDIGSDIDDALCLAYLLAKPECELLGITTVSGQPERRAMLADAICQKAGRNDIPIHSGSARPLLGEQRQPFADQADVLTRWPHQTDFTSNTAVSFLRETIRQRPGEITLLTIGPLTNIALLFRLDPEIPKLLRSLVMMIGAFTPEYLLQGRKVEWNAYLDPYAAAIVYDTPELESLSIGLDVTTQCVLSVDQCRQRLQGGPLDIVREAMEIFAQKSPHMVFHDPLAATAIFDETIMSYTRGFVELELESVRDFGRTLWNPSFQKSPHRVATGVDADRFFQEYFDTLKNLPKD